MPLPAVFLARSEACIREQLMGFTAATIEAVLRLRQCGTRDALRAVLPGLIAFHLPHGKLPLPEALLDEMRLREDIGLDSLALTEMAFKVEEVLGVPIEIREVSSITSVGGLLAFLENKLHLEK